MVFLTVAVISLSAVSNGSAELLGTAINYQGRLNDDGSAANGTYDLLFKILDAPSEGAQVGVSVTLEDVEVAGGLFSVPLDFGAGVFDGDSRWLEIGVRAGNSTGDFVTLSPRQALTAVPYALYAETVGRHHHYGETWEFATSDTGFKVVNRKTGAKTTGIEGETLSTTAWSAGVRGTAPATTGRAVGVIGETKSSSDNATGIYGEADATTGMTSGVWGETRSTSDYAAGVFGMARAETGKTMGVWGETRSVSGMGVYGLARSTSGNSTGVYGESMSTSDDASGVRGLARGRSGKTRGVEGWTESSSDDAVGVYGEAYDPNGKTRGVLGKTQSRTDYAAGVYGEAAGDSGLTHGVWGETKSSTNDAAGVYGEAHATTGKTIGVWGETKSTTSGAIGVYGAARASTGRTIGVWGWTPSTTDGATAVFGDTTGTSGKTVGVYGVTWSDTGTGVHGYGFGAGVGVKAQSTTGNLIEGWNDTANVFKVDNSGNVTAKSFDSPAADFAEMLPGVEGLEPGDVLAIGKDGKVMLAGEGNAVSIIGVYSTEPAFLGGVTADGEDSGRVPVAIMGVVPVKISNENGPVRPNDLLTVSTKLPGHAAKAIPLLKLENGQGIYAGGTIVGRALDGTDAEQGVIRVLVQ